MDLNIGLVRHKNALRYTLEQYYANISNVLKPAYYIKANVIKKDGVPLSKTLRRINILVLFTFVLLCLGLAPNAATATSPAGVAVLVFHQVAPGVTNSVTMTPEDFNTTLQGLTDAGYNFIDLNSLHDYLSGNTTLPDKSVLITFDDGYQGVYQYAHPLLVEHQLPAVMFPITMYYQDDYRLPEQYTAHLTNADITAMQSSGLWSFGGHSFDGHRPILTEPGKYGPFYTSMAWLGQRQETELEYANRIDADLAMMVSTMTSLSLPILDFAPPSSAINHTLEEMLTKNGVRYIYVQDHRLNYPNSPRIYRLTASSPIQVLKDVNTLFGAAPGQSGHDVSNPEASLKALYSSMKQTIYHKTSLMQLAK